MLRNAQFSIAALMIAVGLTMLPAQRAVGQCESAKLIPMPDDRVLNGEFGASVGISGDTMNVGTPGLDNELGRAFLRPQPEPPAQSPRTILNVPGDFATLQGCIDAAVSGVDECVVAPGTYHERINFLGKAITVRTSGGAAVTTIDATGIGGSVVTCRSGEGPDTVLNGFMITGGTGTVGQFGLYGGGMYNQDSSPTVTSCTFRENTATGTYGSGGGMYNQNGSPTVANCTFGGNTATGNGGGIFNYSAGPIVSNCTFTGNATTNYYGGAMANAYSSATVTECAFSGNTASYGGGMYNYVSGPTVTNCTFTGNMARYHGGGMYNDNFSNPTVTNCTFSGNTVPLYGSGGGMSNYFGSPTVIGCTFVKNMAGDGGGMYNRQNNRPTMTKCTFRENRASNGGGMANVYNSATVTECRFSGNTASYGGGMLNSVSSPNIINCTFSGNAVILFGGGMDNESSRSTVSNCIFWGDSPDEIRAITPGTLTLRFTNVQGGLPIGGVDGGGNIDVDPLFARPPDPGPDGVWDGVDDDHGDLRLQAESLCINAGDPALVAHPGKTDLDGHPRVLCDRVDMGPYEFGIGDYDCNGTVDLDDFAAWQSCVTGPRETPDALGTGCEAFDFNNDRAIDLADFAGFQQVLPHP